MGEVMGIIFPIVVGWIYDLLIMTLRNLRYSVVVTLVVVLSYTGLAMLIKPNSATVGWLGTGLVVYCPFLLVPLGLIFSVLNTNDAPPDRRRLHVGLVSAVLIVMVFIYLYRFTPNSQVHSPPA